MLLPRTSTAAAAIGNGGGDGNGGGGGRLFGIRPVRSGARLSLQRHVVPACETSRLGGGMFVYRFTGMTRYLYVGSSGQVITTGFNDPLKPICTSLVGAALSPAMR